MRGFIFSSFLSFAYLHTGVGESVDIFFNRDWLINGHLKAFRTCVFLFFLFSAALVG